MLPPNDLSGEVLARLLVAAALGGLIGLERQIRNKPAGLRTNMFICLGSALFTILSEHVAGATGGDHGRIAAQIITGIGFIGAGAIIRDRGNVVGLTTAATIFVVASLGMAAGLGLYVTAGATALVILVSLSGLGWLEDRLSLKTRLLTFRLTTGNLEAVMAGSNQTLRELNLQMKHFKVYRIGADFVMEFDADVSHTQQQSLMQRLSKVEPRCEVVSRDVARGE